MATLLRKLLNARFLASVQAVVLMVLLVHLFAIYQRNKTQRKELDTMKASIQNPMVVEKVQTVHVTGPTRTITKYIERPGGGKEITVDELVGAVTTGWNVKKEAKAVSLAELETKTLRLERTDRWLVGVSNRSLAFRQLDHYGLWGGYSFRNRLDLLAGVTKHDRSEANVMAVLRF